MFPELIETPKRLKAKFKNIRFARSRLTGKILIFGTEKGLSVDNGEGYTDPSADLVQYLEERKQKEKPQRKSKTEPQDSVTQDTPDPHRIKLLNEEVINITTDDEMQQKCRDPCPGLCGANAECRVTNHNPICNLQARL